MVLPVQTLEECVVRIVIDGEEDHIVEDIDIGFLSVHRS
jgi:hypothetical protein